MALNNINASCHLLRGFFFFNPIVLIVTGVSKLWISLPDIFSNLFNPAELCIIFWKEKIEIGSFQFSLLNLTPLENAIGAAERMKRSKSWLFSSVHFSGWEDGIVFMLKCVAEVVRF